VCRDAAMNTIRRLARHTIVISLGVMVTGTSYLSSGDHRIEAFVTKLMPNEEVAAAAPAINHKDRESADSADEFPLI